MAYTKENLYWKGRRLFFKTPVLVADPKPMFEIVAQPMDLGDTQMVYWIRWPDATVTANYYSLPDAKAIAEELALAELNREEHRLDY